MGGGDPHARAARAVDRADGLADPITGVEAMARLRNRIRRFVVDGEPVATGLVVIGDAAIATNPWYGKGCSTGRHRGRGAVGGAARARPRPGRRSRSRWTTRCARELEPHYDMSCRQDADRIKLHTALHDGGEPDRDRGGDARLRPQRSHPRHPGRPRRVPGVLPLVQHARRPERAVRRPGRDDGGRPGPRHQGRATAAADVGARPRRNCWRWPPPHGSGSPLRAVGPRTRDDAHATTVRRAPCNS